MGSGGSCSAGPGGPGNEQRRAVVCGTEQIMSAGKCYQGDSLNNGIVQ